MLDEHDNGRAGYDGPLDLPDDYDAADQGEPNYGPSLIDDVMALMEDGKTYAEAEITYQKSRAAFTANRLKGAVVFGLGAFGVLHLALIAFAVGLVIALVPLVGPWAATAIVTLALVLLGIVLLRLLKGRIDDIRSAFSEDGHD